MFGLASPSMRSLFCVRDEQDHEGLLKGCNGIQNGTGVFVDKGL